MVGHKRRQKSKVSLMGSHQRCWLWGRHLVLETLRAGRWPIVELRVADSVDHVDRDAASRLASETDIPVHIESAARLTQLCGAADHQGWLAKMRPFPYAPLDELIPDAAQSAALVILDRVQDPYNLGAVIRAADVLGMDGMVIGTESQAGIGSQVARSSAGAVNYLPISRPSCLTTAARALGDKGISLVAAVAHTSVELVEIDLTVPTAFVLGNESVGVSPDLMDVCQASVRIPQTGHIESLNVAVAAGILFYELQRQRHSRR
ncbi:MAG: RNA methyltransferase [Planctomycetaceae bacterium]|nr:RNA methyltransferase [Planctomycetaceae bacterium]